MGKMLTQEQFLQKLVDLNVKHIPLEEYKGSSVKINWKCYKNEKHIFYASPDSVYRNSIKNVDGCSIVPYLKRAAKIGLCDFELNYSKNQIASKNLETISSLWESGIRSVSELMKASGLSNGTVYKMLKRANLQTLPKTVQNKKKKYKTKKIKE